MWGRVGYAAGYSQPAACHTAGHQTPVNVLAARQERVSNHTTAGASLYSQPWGSDRVDNPTSRG